MCQVPLRAKFRAIKTDLGTPSTSATKTTKSELGSKRVGNPANMTTPTPMGNHGGPTMSCSPYAHPGTATP